MDNQTRERIGAAAIAGAGAALVGLLSLLAQLAGGEMERRALYLAWAGLVLGLSFGSFMGFCWVFVGTQLLSKLGVSDWIAASAAIGMLAVPLTPIVIKAINKLVTAWITGSTPT